MCEKYRNEEAERLNIKYAVDKGKLTRDYVDDPIKLPGKRNVISKPDKSDMEYLYLDRNMTLDDLSLYIGMAKGTICGYLSSFNIKKPICLCGYRIKVKCEKYATVVVIDKCGNKLYETPLYPMRLKGEASDIVICVDDIYNDYIVENMAFEEVAFKHKISKDTLRTIIRKFLKMHKDPIKAKEVTARNLYKKYGVVNVFQREDIKEKAKKTTLERYGVDRYSKTDEYVQKVRATKLERYGKENYINVEKCVQTKRENYFTHKQLEVMSSAENFRKFIEDEKVRNCDHMAKVLGISAPTLRRLARKYDCKDLFDYTKSYQESELQEYVKSLVPNTLVRCNANVLDRKEIDAYIPSKALGFEYNGCNWHDASHHVRNYHRLKSLIANRKGIDLVHIFDFQWLYKNEKVRDIVKYRLGSIEEKVSARKCCIDVVDAETFDTFMAENSLYDSKPREKTTIGLFFGRELVLVASYAYSGDWIEIIEIQGKLGICVRGGISRILAAIKRKTGASKFFMNFNFTAFSGVSFKKLGWKFGERLELNRLWAKYKSFFYENEIGKDVLNALGCEEKDTNKKIRKRLRENYYHEVYDCGEIRITKEF